MGKPKQLLPFKGKPLLCHIVEQALGSQLNSVAVVLGHGAEKIREVLKSHGFQADLKFVYNAEYRKGMATSIRAGVRAVADQCEHVIIMLADMPYIDSELINLLLENYLNSGKDLGAVVVQGRRSHPVVFSKKYFPLLLSLQGDIGGRELFRAHGKEACLVDAGPHYCQIDLDTPKDYKKLTSQNP